MQARALPMGRDVVLCAWAVLCLSLSTTQVKWTRPAAGYGLKPSWTGRTPVSAPNSSGRGRTPCVHGRRDRGHFREATHVLKRHLAESGHAAQSPVCSLRAQGINSCFAAKGGLWQFCHKEPALAVACGRLFLVVLQLAEPRRLQGRTQTQGARGGGWRHRG